MSLALLPVAFALATLVGEGLLAVQGYGNAGVGTVSASAALWAGGPGLLVLMAPGAAALFFGLRARRHGRSAGLTPAAIGGVTILGSIALNVLAFLIGR